MERAPKHMVLTPPPHTHTPSAPSVQCSAMLLHHDTAAATAAGDMDVALALHACGAASDYALLAALERQAAFVVSPCCTGKITRGSSSIEGRGGGGSSSGASANSSPAGTSAAAAAAAAVGGSMSPSQPQLQYPRSGWMVQGLLAASSSRQQAHPAPAAAGAAFAALARAADFSHAEGHGYAGLAALAKSNLELDRVCGMAESGYDCCLVKLLQPGLTAKSDVLVGVPQHQEHRFWWPWRAMGPGGARRCNQHLEGGRSTSAAPVAMRAAKAQCC